MNCKEYVQDAIKYESVGLWKSAQDCYYQLLQTDISPERKDFYYESYFKCFANLGEWNQIPNAIASIIDSERIWDSLWDGDFNQQKLLPWYIRGQITDGLFQQTMPENLFENINACLVDDNRSEYLKLNYSEELCMMSLFQKDIPLATIYLKNFVKHFLEEWQLVNPMFQTLRYQKLLKVHGFMEINNFIGVCDKLSEDYQIPIPKLLSKWEDLSEEHLPSLLITESRHLYRVQFLNILIDKLSKLEGTIDYNTYEKRLKISRIRMDLNLINLAAEGNNYHLARKYYEPYDNKENPKIKMACGNLQFAKSKMLSNPEDELQEKLLAQDIFGM